MIGFVKHLVPPYYRFGRRHRAPDEGANWKTKQTGTDYGRGNAKLCGRSDLGSSVRVIDVTWSLTDFGVATDKMSVTLREQRQKFVHACEYAVSDDPELPPAHNTERPRLSFLILSPELRM